MFYVKLKGVSKIGLAAVGGIISAGLGAFFGWLLFPALIAINVDKVNVHIIWIKKNVFSRIFLCKIIKCDVFFFGLENFQ